ncbi:MAG: spondin domain-containing protein [Cyanobacteria bacterium P01_F01_bin.86]
MVLTNNFEDGTTQGWGVGNSSHPNPPSNVASGGPDGSEDNFLQTEANGGAGAGSRLAFFNDNPEWTGDYTAGGVTGITASAINQGSGNVVLRVALDGAGGRFVTTEGVTLSPGSSWQDVAFSIAAEDLTAVGGTDAAATLSDVSQIRFINNATPSYQGSPVAAQVGIDNIETVGGEPGGTPVTPPVTPPTGDLPVVSFEVVPANFSEEVENNPSGTNLVEWKWTVTGDFPEDGIIVNLDTSGGGAPFAFLDQFAAEPPTEFVDSEIVDFDNTGRINIRLDAPEASFKLYFFNDILEEGAQEFTFQLADGDGYTVDADTNGGPFIITDDNGGPGVGPTIGITTSETDLAEGDTFTVTFTADGEIPAEGVQVLVQSDVPGSLGQFDLANLGNLITTGLAGLPEVGDAGGGSFFITMTEPTATITLDVFDDILAEEPLPITFTVANGEEYEVDADNAGITLNITDEVQPAGPTVSLTTSSTELVEGGDPFTLTITVDGEIPEDGLPILINDAESAQNQVRSLTEFDVANVITTGIAEFPSPAEGDSGFFVTVTEPTATITLSAFDDGADEDEAVEVFNFAVIDGEGYEVNPDAGSVTLSISDADGSTPPADPPTGDLPVVSFTTTTPVVTEDEQPAAEFVFTIDGDIPDDGQGVVVTIGGDGIEKLFAPRLLDGNIPLAFEPADGVVPIGFTGTEVILGFTVPEVTATAVIFDDIVEEAADVLNFEILPADSYTIDQGTASITIEDGASANPGGGPTVSFTTSDADLVEGEEFTVFFDVDETTGAIPEEGLQLFIDGGPTDLGEFNIFGENGIDPDTDLVGLAGFPEQGDDLGGFFVTLVEPQASITLSVFEDGPGEGEDILNFELANGEQYEVNPDASGVDLTINDTPAGLPIVSLNLEPAVVSEEDAAPSFTATFTVTNGEIPAVELDSDGNYVSGGLSVFVDGGLDIINIFDEVSGAQILDGVTLGSFFDPDQPGLVEFILLESTATASLDILNDVIEEADQDYTFNLLNDENGLLGSNYVVNPGAASATVTLIDDNGGPGVGPTVGVTVTDTELTEGEAFTVNFTVDGDDVPSAENPLTVLVDSPTFAALGEFALFDDSGTPLFSTTGIAGVPQVGDTGASSFLVDIIDANASISLSVFEDGPDEGLETLTFDLVNGEEYEVSETNGSFTLNIDDGGSEPPTPGTDSIEVLVTVESLAPVAGNFLTPVWVGFHNGEFDLYNRGEAVTPGLESLAEDGSAALLSEEFVNSGFGAVDGVVLGPEGLEGPIDPGEIASATFTLDLNADNSQFFSYASMIIPSNDAFIANGDPMVHSLFDADGNFVGADFIVAGSEVLDAGTEVNDELVETTAFFSQAEPNAGEDENGGVELHPGFLENGRILSEDGNTEGAPAAFTGADFTADGYQAVRITVEEVTPEPPAPVVSLSVEPAVVSEEDEGAAFTLVITVDGEIPTPEFDADGNLVSGGLSVLLGPSDINVFGQFGGSNNFENFVFGPNNFFGAIPDSFASELILLDNTARLTQGIFNDILEEPDTDYSFQLVEAGDFIDSNYAINPDAGSATFTLVDGIGGPGVGPEVSISVSATEIEEGDEIVVSFEVDGEIPEGGVQVFVGGGTPTDVGEFVIFNEDGSPAIELEGIDEFPLQGGAEGGFFVTLVENQASITLSVFDDGANEGPEAITFTLANGEVYEVAPGADSITININDFEVVGTDEGETLVGDEADNSIAGEDGADTIAGGLGNDIILGGDGDDVLRGDLNERSPQDGVAGGNDIIFGGEGNDRIGGKAGNDILSGDAGDDFIWGDDGDDIIMGVTGNDTLVGDNGSDGSGSDLFVFGNGDGTDTIVDFEVGTDRIGLVDGELTFADLTITQDGNNTLLGVAEGGEVIAVLQNVEASALTESSFEVVPDVSNPDEALALI